MTGGHSTMQVSSFKNLHLSCWGDVILFYLLHIAKFQLSYSAHPVVSISKLSVFFLWSLIWQCFQTEAIKRVIMFRINKLTDNHKSLMKMLAPLTTSSPNCPNCIPYTTLIIYYYTCTCMVAIYTIQYTTHPCLKILHHFKMYLTF